MNLILIEQNEMGADGTVCLSGSRARHIRDVLKALPGMSIRVGLINGLRGQGTILELSVDRVILGCSFDEPAPPPPKVDLLLALPRPKVMRRLWA